MIERLIGNVHRDNKQGRCTEMGVSKCPTVAWNYSISLSQALR